MIKKYLVFTALFTSFCVSMDLQENGHAPNGLHAQCEETIKELRSQLANIEEIRKDHTACEEKLAAATHRFSGQIQQLTNQNNTQTNTIISLQNQLALQNEKLLCEQEYAKELIVGTGITCLIAGIVVTRYGTIVTPLWETLADTAKTCVRNLTTGKPS